MSDKKKNIRFVACTYAFFWIVIILIEILASTLQSKGIVSQLMLLVGAWAPTIALLILFKMLFPNSTIKRFYQNAFREQLNIRLLLLVTVVQALIVICTAGMIAFTKGVPLINLFDFSTQSIAMCVVVALLTGASGEESGWRGFLQPSFEKKFTVISSSLIIGIIWAFWHAPLWFWWYGVIAVYCLICNNNRVVSRCDRYLLQPL